jgi:uncharacterized protein (TIGR02246 family)
MNRSTTLARILLAPAIAAFAGACAAAPPDTRVQDEATIRAAEAAWSGAAHSKDIEKTVSYYAADAIALPPNEPQANGPAEIRKMWESMLNAPGMNLTWQTAKVDISRSGDVAYSNGTYQMTMTGADGKPAADHGKYVTIWKKQSDGNWKSVVDIFNSDVPLPASPPPPPAPSKKGK